MILTILTVPWWAEVNVFFGFVLFYWILVPVLYYTNVSLGEGIFHLRHK